MKETIPKTKKERKYTCVDLHSHFIDFGNILNQDGSFYSGMLQKNKDSAQNLLEHCFSIHDCTLTGIIGIEDYRVFRIMNGLKQTAEKLKYEIQEKGNLTSIIDEKKRIANFIIGEEITGNKGHILVVGNKKRIYSKKFPDALNEARDNGGEFIIPVHPLQELGFFSQEIIRVLNGNISLGISEKDIQKYQNYFDAIEVWNGCMGNSKTKKIIRISKELGLPGIACSDAHRSDFVHSSFTKMYNLNFTDYNSFITSFKESLKNICEEDLGKKYTFFERCRHSLSVANVAIGLKLKYFEKESS